MIYKLEDLPNEILMAIVEYVAEPAGVINSFRNLNRRFTDILRSVSLSLDIYLEDQQSLTVVHHFSRHCRRLRIYGFCPLISLEQFPRLRSLTLTEPTDAQIHSIQSATLPMLEYLASPASASFLECLFGDDQRKWQHLRTCKFYFSYFSQSKLSWQINPTLRSLSGIICCRSTLGRLLSLLPCLKHLCVDMISNDCSNWNLAIFRKTLLSLRIGFCQLNYDDLRALIGPCLRRLHIEVTYEQVSIDFSYLGALLASLTPKLRRFNCDYRGVEVGLDRIKGAHASFQNIQSIQSHSYDAFSLVCRDVIQFAAVNSPCSDELVLHRFAKEAPDRVLQADINASIRYSCKSDPFH